VPCRVAVLILSAINWPVVKPHIEKISLALDEAQPGTVKTIDCGVFAARLKRNEQYRFTKGPLCNALNEFLVLNAGSAWLFICTAGGLAHSNPEMSLKEKISGRG
jgi:hypothetical protein